MTTTTSVRLLARRSVWALSALALVVMLTLAACGGQSAHQGNNGGANTGATTTNTSTAPSSTGGSNNGGSNNAQQAESADQQIQAALQAMDAAQNDANVNYGSQDNPVQP